MAMAWQQRLAGQVQVAMAMEAMATAMPAPAVATVAGVVAVVGVAGDASKEPQTGSMRSHNVHSMP